MLIILLIWIISILAVLPTSFATGLFEFPFAGTELIIKEICGEKWPNPTLHLLYSIALMIVQVIDNQSIAYLNCFNFQNISTDVLMLRYISFVLIRFVNTCYSRPF